MADAFKHLLNRDTVRAEREHLTRAWKRFDGERFERLASNGLAALELKARAQHICGALEATLPPDFGRAATVIEASLAPLREGGKPEPAPADGLAGWALWPLAEYVARRGLDHPVRALATLHAITQRFTAEFAIRPFIEQHPALTLATLAEWTRDASPQVRRLVSEGSRPRLPWGAQLKAFVADPSPTLPLLAALQDDPSDDVRRSVANHLNDIAKDHPDVLIDWLSVHLADAPPSRRALLKHASRTLIKAGDPKVLKAWGLGRRFVGSLSLAVSPRRMAMGDTLALEVTLSSTAARRQKLVIDYAVHHVKADGRTTPKVFKGWSVELAPREQRQLSRKHVIRPITTRRYHAGEHTLDIRVNGEVLASAAFDLRL